MLEIDGEFFEDPCESMYAVRAVVATALLEAAFISYEMIMAEPLFPAFEKGGIVNPNSHSGDIVYVK